MAVRQVRTAELRGMTIERLEVRRAGGKEGQEEVRAAEFLGMIRGKVY